MWMSIGAAVISFVVCFSAFPRFIRWALANRFVDRPGGRKVHAGAVPPVGGLLIVPVFLCVAVLCGFSPLTHWTLYLALLIILAVGVMDDRRGVAPRLKFVVHFLVAGLVVLSGEAQLTSLGPLFGAPFELGILAVPFSIACVVYLINAMNMIDGLDGLAGGLAFVIAGLFGLMAALAGAVWLVVPLAALMGALAGFLAYNMRAPWRPKAIVFLGDAGSMSLGVILAWAAMQIGQAPKFGNPPILDPIAVAFVLALPIIDAFALLYTRLRSRQPPFQADRNHLHHRFLDAGFTPGQASISLILISVLLGMIGIGGLMMGVPHPALTTLWIVLWLGHAAFIRRPALVTGVLAHIHTKVFGPVPPPA